MRTTRLLVVGAPLMLLVLAACGGQQPSATPATANQPAINAAAALQTFDGRYIQIDACPNTIPPFPNLPPFSGLTPGCGGNWSGDANLVLGNDNDMLLAVGKTAVSQPGPASMSLNFPAALTNPSPTFIDWDSLTGAANFANHFRSDFSAGTDPTAFPGSNSCVGAANVLDKMNLTYVSVSNNTDYAYFGVQRRDNSGDAGYMWIFNKLPPPSFGNEQSLLGTNDGLGDNCGTSAYPLTFKVSTGDVLFKGHFAPSSTIPLLAVFKVTATITASTTVQDGNTTFTATCDQPSGPCYVILPAKSAINWEVTINGTTTTLWTEEAGFVSGAAANTSLAGLASTGSAATNFIGSVGLKSLIPNGGTYKATDGTTWQCTDPNGCMEDNLFAEVAVPITAFTGGSVCGATFYGSVISRSSGTTPSPDMKDLAGPYQFNFGSASVTATASPSCDQKFGYEITSFTGLGGSGTPTSCTWKLNGPGFAADYVFDSTCDSFQVEKFFSNANLNGTYNLSVTASDATGCSATTTAGPVNVYPPLGATAGLTGSCALKFDYTGSASGGSGGYTYAWAFSGPGTTTPSSSTTASGTGVAVSTAGTYTGDLTVTDNRTDISCTKPASATTPVYAPVAVVLSATPASAACDPTNPNADFSTAATFTATASGGSGGYSYIWGGACSGTGTGSTTCTVDDSTTCADASLNVKVSDSICGNSNNPTGKYDKTTTVTTSVSNP